MRTVVILFIIYHLINEEFIKCLPNESSFKYSEEFENFKVIQTYKTLIHVNHKENRYRYLTIKVINVSTMKSEAIKHMK